MKMLTAALVLAIAPITAHAADNFTFVTTGKAIGAVRVPAQGPNFQGAQVNDTSAVVTYADGHKETVTAKCATWTNAPGSQFIQSGVCTSPNGYEQNYSCALRVAPKQGVNCWGILHGTAGGKYAGRTGLLTYTNGPEGLSGVGSWD